MIPHQLQRPVTVLLRCVPCGTEWRLEAGAFLRAGSRPPGLTCPECGGYDVKKVEVTDHGARS
jgi:hypothetical protein